MSLFIIAFLISFITTYLVKIVAQKKSLIDIPNERSSHTIATPRGGGLAIAITWFVGITYMYYNDHIKTDLYYALISGTLLSTISFLDDIYNLKSLPRFIVQCTVAAVALYCIGGIKTIDLGFFVIENTYLLNTIAFVGIVWFINLFNFIDGIDGYAASESVFICIAFYFFIGDNILLLLAIAVLGFLPWNWDKAKIFMGDIGSTLLGFSICILSIYFHNTGKFSIINSLILSSLFWFDATFTLFKRFMNKEQLGQAHKKHAYQRIVQSGFSHQKTVMFAMLINIILFSIVFISQYNKDLSSLCLVVDCIIMYFLYTRINAKKPFV
jgi:Fuc2NAc and GlcNAc transferase